MDYGDVLFKSFKKHIVVKEDKISGKQTHFYILFYLSICSLVLFAFMLKSSIGTVVVVMAPYI